MKIKPGQVAVITGAAGGLGSALARELAGRGCHLALSDINEGALEALKTSLSRPGINITTHVINVSKKADVSKLAKEVVDAHGGVNLLINNAGITIQKTFSTHTFEDWERMIGINLWGVIYGCHFFDAALTAEEDAHVVNLSSMAAFMGLPNQSSYCATKSGVQGLTEAMWPEWAVKGVGMTCVHPGAIKTDMILATLKDSDDLEAAKRNYRFAQKTGVEPAKAAKIILKAVERGKLRVRVGKDAVIMDILKRLMPSAVHKLMLGLARRTQKSQEGSNA